MPAKTVKEETIELQPSNLETIDTAFYNWVKDELNIFCSTNTGWRKVPVVWTGQERVHQIKNNPSLRDSEGSLVFPIITIKRDSVAKDPTRKGPFWGNVPSQDMDGGSIVYSRRIKTDKTAAFRNEQQYNRTGQLNFVTKNRNELAIVYETLYLPMPVSVKIMYKVEMKTQFQQQMNEMLQVFETTTGNINYFRFGLNGHSYEGFMPNDISSENNDSSLEEDERIFYSSLDIETIGYIYAQGKNHPTPRVVTKENIAQVKIPRETTIFDPTEWEKF